MIEALTKMHLSRKRILDMGTGSGILGLYCAMNGADVTASDIDEAAIQETERAAKRLGVELRLYVSDLFLTLQGRFELIIFNPPYLPSQIREDRAVDGGPSGTMLIDTFLNALPEHLEKNGASLLLLSSLNDPNSVQQRHTNLNFTTIARRSLFFEEILVLRVSFRNDLTI
jgi:release factor glutamine methyltransferase